MNTSRRTVVRRSIIALVAAALVVSMAGCKVAKAGTRCRGTELGRDATHVLACRNGRWVRTVTLFEAGRAIRNQVIANGPRLEGVKAIAAADDGTCAITADHNVKCWGTWVTGAAAPAGTHLPVRVDGLTSVTQIDLGDRFGCALIADGTVSCWGGYNRLGQLGDGTTTDHADPVKVHGVSNAVQITAGGDHACARLADGRVQCWGANGYGELGNGTFVTDFSATKAVTVLGISGALDVAAGFQHTCALLPGSSVACWGSNHGGELGWFAGEISTTPVEIIGARGASGVEANGSRTCATFDDGTVWCWGQEYRTDNDIPPDLPPVASVSLGRFGSTCAATIGGRVRCWGGSDDTFHGDSRTDAMTDVVQVASGYGHSCALRASGQVVCWGDNDDGQLGDGLDVWPIQSNDVVTVAKGA